MPPSMDGTQRYERWREGSTPSGGAFWPPRAERVPRFRILGKQFDSARWYPWIAIWDQCGLQSHLARFNPSAIRSVCISLLDLDFAIGYFPLLSQSSIQDSRQFGLVGLKCTLLAIAIIASCFVVPSKGTSRELIHFILIDIYVWFLAVGIAFSFEARRGHGEGSQAYAPHTLALVLGFLSLFPGFIAVAGFLGWH